MTAPARLGILGGTLDPIHQGHLDAACAARDVLALDEVRLLPSRVPPHRHGASASAFHRFAMVALAINGLSRLQASDDELLAPGPSYTVDTLERLRQAGLETSQIFFIIGADAFADIATWHRYPEVLDLTRFVVIARPGHPLAELRRRLPSLASRMRAAEGGHAGPDASIVLLEASTADVSSTAIRNRLRRGLPVHGLVPPAVETHILQHGLYRAAVAANQLHGQD